LDDNNVSQLGVQISEVSMCLVWQYVAQNLTHIFRSLSIVVYVQFVFWWL